MSSRKPLAFDKEYAKIQLNDMKKQGYTSICCMPAWLQNEYRELSLEKAVKVVNEWIDEYKVNHEHVVIFSLKNCTKVVTETMYNKLISAIKIKLKEKKF